MFWSMTKYNAICQFEGCQIGSVSMDIVDTREEAEEGDRGWFGSRGIVEQMSIVKIEEIYPAAYIRSVEIVPEFRRRKFGSDSISHLLNHAAYLGCRFSYAIVETASMEQMSINHEFYDKLGWSLYHESGGKIVSSPFKHEVFSMGYIALEGSFNSELQAGFVVREI